MRLRQMLQMILNNNPNVNKFVFTAKKNGILVKGVDTSDIRKFNKFYSSQDIYHYFNELNKRLERK